MLLGVGCTSDAPTAAPDPTVRAVTAIDASYRDAVRATMDAARLVTSARIRVATAGGVAEVALEGRREGDDRQVVLTTDRGEVTYAVVDGAATVDRGDGPVAVEAAEVPTTPSLASLLQVDDLAFPQVGVATGTLALEDLTGLAGTGDGTIVDVVVHWTQGGLVDGLELRGPEDAYVAVVSYRTA